MSVLNAEPEGNTARTAIPPGTDTGCQSPECSLAWRLRAVAARALASLDSLAENRASFVLALLALNALALPYADSQQDDRLYAFQVQNVIEGGRFDGDLFFRYGSQDRYSIFSIAAAPLARVLGIPLSFFLLYLAGKALYTVALVRFVEALVPQRTVAALALVALSITLVPFAGLGIFFVGENILTPRMLASALVLFSLERMIRDRLGSAFILVLGALVLHPLMAFGGLLVFLGWCASRYLSVFQAVAGGVAAFTLGLLVLLYQPLGVRLLGAMDDVWFEAVRRVNPYQVPAMWLPGDWLRIVVAFATVLGACSVLEEPRVRRFLRLLLAAAALGVAGSVVACWLPYALPVQAQPYRVLWLLQLVQLPLAVLLIAQWWRADALPRRVSAVLLAGYLTLDTFNLLSTLPVTAALCVFALWHWAVPRQQEGREICRPALVGLGLGMALWLGCHLGEIAVHWDKLEGVLDPFDYAHYWSAMLNPLCRLVVSVAVVFVVVGKLGAGPRFRAVALAVCLLVQFGSFAFSRPEWLGGAVRSRHEDTRFVRDFLQAHADTRVGPPTVYWSLGRLECIWLELPANSYFYFAQLSGNSFNRDTALEGQRRIDLVRPFEIEFYRNHGILMQPKDLRTIRETFQATLTEPPPTRADLCRLCQDPALDFVVVLQGFDGLYAATNGAWFLYECRAVRAALRGQKIGAEQDAAESKRQGVP